MQKVDPKKWILGGTLIKNRELNLINSRSTLITLAEKGYLRVKKVDGKIYYNLDDAKRYVQLITDIKENFLTPAQIARLEGFVSVSVARKAEEVKQFCINEGIDFKELDNSVRAISSYNREERIFVKKAEYLKFREGYLTKEEVFQTFDFMNQVRITYLVKNIKAVRQVTIWRNLKLYCKEDLEKINRPSRVVINSRVSHVDVSPKECYTQEEVFSILNINSMDVWLNYRDKNKISYYNRPHYKSHLYLKKDIDELRKKQVEYLRDYYSYSQVLSKKIVAVYDIKHHKVPSIKADALIKAAFGEPTIYRVFPKVEMDKFLKKMSIKNQLSQIDYKGSLIDAFERYLQVMDWLYETETQTKTRWFEYCHDKLRITEKNANLKTRTQRVIYLGQCTKILFDFLQARELFMVSAAEINLGLLRGNHSTHRHILYNFCLELHDVLTYNGKPVHYELRQLKSPYSEQPKTKIKKGIYTFAEYQEFLNYAADLKIHKDKAIEDALNKIAKKRTTHYASTWLYILTSLNNAWRHPDIIYNLTTVNIQRLGICSIEDLRSRDLTTKEADQIIRQVMAKDKSHTKTNATARFFCSNVLAIPFATAAIICTLMANELNLGDEMIQFGNTYNEPSDHSLIAFFKASPNSLEFKLQKMNRSLLTLIYQLLVDKGYGSAALEVAQRLRSHFNYESTNIYIQIPTEKLDELTEQLFNRQHFGYIHHTFLDFLYGPEESRSSRTRDIVSLNKILNVYEIEAAAGFIQKVHSEKQTVMEKIMSMSLQDVREYLFKLSLSLLPSKEDHVQCFVSESGCVHQETRACHNCAYAIPNFYTISAMADSLTNLLLHFQEAFYATRDKAYGNAQRIKLANILYKEIDTLKEACDTFGEEEVLSFFEGGAAGFKKLLECVNQVSAADINEYVSKAGGDQ